MLENVLEFRVRFGETDAAGIVFYPNYYKWMDEGTHALMEKAGFPTRRLFDERAGFPLVEALCRFRRPLSFGDRIRLVSRVEEVRNKSMRVSHVFYRDGELVAEGYEVRAWIRGIGGRIASEPIPDEIRRALLGEGGVIRASDE